MKDLQDGKDYQCLDRVFLSLASFVDCGTGFVQEAFSIVLHAGLLDILHVRNQIMKNRLLRSY